MNPRLLPLIAAVIVVASPCSRAAADVPKPPLAEYRDALTEMVRAFNDRDFDRTQTVLEKVEKLRPPNPYTINVRAAIAIERKQWDEGVKLCRQALKMEPGYWAARLNLAEIPMMRGKPAEARAIFQKMLEEKPSDELIQYRIFLTYLLERNDNAAREALGKLKFPSETPAFYYANAAWEFSHDHEAEGLAWASRGNWEFGSDRVLNFAELALVRVGLLKHSVGGNGNLSDADSKKLAGDKPAEVTRAPDVGFDPQRGQPKSSAPAFTVRGVPLPE